VPGLAPVVFFRALALVGMTGLTLAASACGGSSDANGSGSSSASDSRDPMAWSACMRSHGVPTFPDPDGRGRIQIPSSIDDRLPTVRAAYRACRNLASSESSLTGQGDVMHQDLLPAFTRCMRSHGAPEFPRPAGRERPHLYRVHTLSDRPELADRHRSDGDMPKHAQARPLDRILGERGHVTRMSRGSSQTRSMFLLTYGWREVRHRNRAAPAHLGQRAQTHSSAN
jgi:hypothetical protein